ncbi:unnamed protein product [Spirodela intermedia]|uniref:O-fucosyltransferase family protein n=1 Tax=Spirodela intermedia TaxID=51605 RepID=A0A7I8I9Y9_SPIIN|nr:unnamed protein product [Spirodela intermedia]CAA6654527.1 unnamed protein product [Spirodela intermedia]
MDWWKMKPPEIPLHRKHQPAPATKSIKKNRISPCLSRVIVAIVVWATMALMIAIVGQWEPTPPTCVWPTSCLERTHGRTTRPPTRAQGQSPRRLRRLPTRVYKNNGYLRVSCNGICDMVTIARYLNLTLLVPGLDKRSFWADPSDFQDIFDVQHFINSLRDEVRIVDSLPSDFNKSANVRVLEMPPVSWSSEKYYMDKPSGEQRPPLELQKLRCKVNYEALKFAPSIQAVGDKLVSLLKRGPFIVLHLRYEMDMLAFSGCSRGCSSEEAEELRRMRYAYPWWKEKEIDSEKKRLEGLCPLTPEETALVMQALGISRDTQVYIASGEIYGGEKRMATLRNAYPDIVRKEMLLTPDELSPFQNRSTQMAALDYQVSIASDTFIPTYDGNMAKVVEGHRRYMGFLPTISLDRKRLVELIDLHQNGTLSWSQFSALVKRVHRDRLGKPTTRRVIDQQPKLEDNFYSNPQECLHLSAAHEHYLLTYENPGRKELLVSCTR